MEMPMKVRVQPLSAEAFRPHGRVHSRAEGDEGMGRLSAYMK